MWSKFSYGRNNFQNYIMDKYYEMFRGKNSANKKDFFNSPDSTDHSDQDTDTDGWTRLRVRKLGVEWGGVSCVWERNQFVIY